MTRSRTALVALALAAVGAAGCTGSGDASQSDVQGDVEEQLLEDGYVASADAEPIDVSAEHADAIGSCVARTMFEDTEQFTKDERNAATSADDGDEPDPDLVLKVEALVNDCYDQVVEGGDEDEESGTGSDEDQTADDEEGSDPSEETTTTEG